MVESASGLKIHLHLEEGSRLPQPVANLLFYVTQEAIRNARQHSRAKRIDVTLTRTPGSVTLSVKDDGIGFRPQESQGSAYAG